MEGRMWLYSGLIVVILALMGFGIWFVMNPEDNIEIPEEDPIVLMDINNPEAETLSQLSLYEDGTVVYVVDSDKAMPASTGDEFTRTWYTGKATASDIDDLFEYLGSIEFGDMDSTYVSDEILDAMEAENVTDINELKSIGPGFTGDNYIRISVDTEEIDNTVVAIGYLDSDSDPYSELPYPIDFIYEGLADIIDSRTQEVQTEDLTQ